MPKTVSRKLPQGLYLKQKDFFAGKPSMSLAFEVVPNYLISTNGDNKEKDTIQLGMDYKLLDTTLKRPRDLYGFSDGNDFYIAYYPGYYKFGFIGKFSFVTVKFLPPKNTFILFNPVSLLASVVASAVATVADRTSRLKEKLYFFDKKKHLVEADNNTMRWLLDDDQDFSQASYKIKHHTNVEYKEFIMKMNERYPE